MNSTFGLELTIVCLLISANGLFAMAEMAIISARKSRLRRWAKEGNKRAVVALDLAASPNRFLSTVQFGITLIGILAGAFGGATIAQTVSSWVENIPPLAPHANKIGFGIVVACITLSSLIFGEILPKRLALAQGERIACRLAPAMYRLSLLATPFVSFVGWVIEIALKILHVKSSPDTSVNDEDIRVMVEQGSHAGVFHKAEIELVSGVMRLDDTRVEDIMLPIAQMLCLETTDRGEILNEKIAKAQRSYLPLRNAGDGRILGLVAVRDLWLTFGGRASSEIRLETIAATPLLVPESAHAVKLLEAFKRSSWHAALVVNEYGEISGMVSILDVMETIAGDFSGNHHRALDDPRVLPDGTWLAGGLSDIHAVARCIDPKNTLALPQGKYHTLGGMVVAMLGRIPEEGDRIEWEDYWVEVLNMDRNRVDKLRIVRRADSPAGLDGPAKLPPHTPQ
ncbi:hemolysin family protein [Verrucomicrobia bacterium]|nr:hemolysin family protein [Verrucomicrobiota bacterium]MDG1890036.1 hemolysin family protein [Verrucomicrobiota bacterium]